MKLFLVGGSGYCGAYLAAGLREAGHEVTTLDLRPGSDIQGDYRGMSVREITDRGCEAVLWFAGRSAVRLAEMDPLDSLDSNCLGLGWLREKLPPHIPLIYASTASLYSNPNSSLLTPAHEDDPIPAPTLTAYDRSKFAFDYIQQGFLKNCLGLRMGTVCGWGAGLASLRRDSCFNAMNLAALQTGALTLTQGDSWRTFLFLPTLLEVVTALLLARPSYRIINVGDISLSMGTLAKRIAGYHKAHVIEANTSTPNPYSFRLDLSRQEELLGRHAGATGKEVETACAAFRYGLLEERA